MGFAIWPRRGPQWSENPPPEDSFRSVFKWGDPAGFKHPNRRLVALLKRELGLTAADFRRRVHEGLEAAAAPPPEMDLRHVAAFSRIVGPDNVDQSPVSRVRYGCGKSMEEILNLRQGLAPDLPDAVVHPRNKGEVREILSYCSRHGIAVRTVGGATSVTRGLSAPSGGIALAMRTHMNRILELDEEDHTVRVEPGITGPELEAFLNNAPRQTGARRPYTCGHFPQSFELATVGGWIAAMGAGQESSFYGDACDLVFSQEYVTPAGTLASKPFPAAATGPKVDAILTGSEGVFGILVEVTLKIFRYLPRNRRRFAFLFPGWEPAVQAAREISQGQFGMPSVFRISDPEETDAALQLYGISGTPLDWMMRLRGFRTGNRCLFLGQADGERGFTRNLKRRATQVCRRFGALWLGGYPVARWARGRFSDPYLRDDLNDYGVVIDTLETAVSWRVLEAVYRAVRRVIKARPRTICMTHASHFYPQGTNLYFIFITRVRDVEDFQQYHAGIVAAIVEAGGALSHHHGVGRMFAPWMERYAGSVHMDVLRALKQHFDPMGILNPGGTLGVDGGTERLRDGGTEGNTRE